MTTAFHGDPWIKSDLHARLRRHAAAGTLVFGATRWDGVSGSPLGVSAESDDCADYAARFGYPLALTPLLDMMTAYIAPERALADTLAWVETVSPGADLSWVPLGIAEEMLVRMGAADHAPSRHAAVLDLQRRDMAGETITRADWTALRREMEAATDDAHGPEAVALRACAMACWPLRTSRSVVASLVQMWQTGAPPSPDFSVADRIQAEETLHAIIAEMRPRREDIPGLFRDRDPDLSRRYEAELRRVNLIAEQRIAALPPLILHHLAAAGTP
ncbi:hypothetical protein [uncultured Sphingomonas sp.]|uniref:hypothetical protein n=1 Tax=uncultured Sphingomonas sp. TaxID=158754 RepID=UPI00260F01CF|nr:hypothetical protein [uncultured Sphingomonas sp.]